MKAEIDANPQRPLIVSWSFWNPQETNFVNVVNGNSYHYYTWGQVVDTGANGENYNHDDQTSGPQGGKTLGHDVTAVGYCENYDPDNLGFTYWLIVHDNWNTTDVNVAIPWDCDEVNKLSYWVANTTVNPSAPQQIGSLNVAFGPNNPVPAVAGGVMWLPPGKTYVQMADLQFTAGNNEGVAINAITLAPGGTGNLNDIVSVSLVDPNNDGVASGQYPANGNLTITIPGPGYVVGANGVRDLYVYYTFVESPGTFTTFNFTVQTIYATGNTYFLPISPVGLPLVIPRRTFPRLHPLLVQR